MPIPVTARQGPSMMEQLADILSPGRDFTPTANIDAPRVVPFVYQPAERGARARSASPVSMETLPPRPRTTPMYHIPRQRHGHPRTRPSIPSEPETLTRFAPVQPQQPQPQPPIQVLANEPPVPVQQPTRPDRQHYPGPTPRPVIPLLYGDSRPPTAPGSLGGGDDAPRPSWYRPSNRIRDQARPPPLNIPPTNTVVELPPLFNSLMEILRENRLAQLATVDQQRELMRYMRGLNEWLERDVHDRQSEIRGVVARVEQLGHDLRGIQMQGRRTPSTGSSSGSSDSGPHQMYFPGQGPQPTYPILPPTFQPYPPVIPPVIPDGGTPPPSFRPVIPQPTIVVNPGAQMIPGSQMIPTDGYHHPIPGPMPGMTPRPQETGIFIPPDTASIRSGSTGPPRPGDPHPLPIPHPGMSGMGTNVIHYPGSPSSSRSETPSRGSSRGRRPSRSTRHDSPPRHPRHDSRSTRRTPHDRRSSRSRTPPRRRRSRSSDGRIPLVVTNPSAGRIPAVLQDSYGQPGTPHQLSTHAPPIHVISPSAGSSSPRMHRHESYPHSRPPSQPQPAQTPTIIIQQPPQQPQQPVMMQMPPSPGMQMSDGGMMPMTPGVPVTHMGQMGVPMTAMGHPMTGVPGSYYPPPMTGPPMIIQQPSRSSSRSDSRGRRHRHTPPPAPAAAPAAPIILTGPSRRSRSRSRSHGRRTPPPQMAMGPGVTLLPSQYPPGMPGPGGVVMMPSRHSSRSRSRSPRRRRSHSPPVIINQPGAPAPTIYPGPTQSIPQQPILVPGMGPMGMMPGMAPIVMPRGSHSRSRSRSPRGGAPIIIPPGQSSRRYSRSRSPRRHSRSRSPRRSRTRSPRRHSRSRSPRHHSPPRYPPTVPIVSTIPGQPMMIPGQYPTYRHHSRSRSRSPRSPRVQVVGDPYGRSHGRSRSPPRHYSPSHRPRSRSPEDRYRPRPYSPSDRRRSPSDWRRRPSTHHGRPSYSRSPSPSYRDRDPYRPRTHYPSDRGRPRSYSPSREHDARRHPHRPPVSRSLSPRSTRSRSPIPLQRSDRARTPTRAHSPSGAGRSRFPTRSGSPLSQRSQSRTPPRRGTTRLPTDTMRSRSLSPHSPTFPRRVATRRPTGTMRSRSRSPQSPPRVIVTSGHRTYSDERERPGLRRPGPRRRGSQSPGSRSPGSQSPEPRSPDTVRITVPSRSGAQRPAGTHRPPTVMAIDDTAPVHGFSGDSFTVHSVDDDDRRPIPIVRSSAHDRPTTPIHRPEGQVHPEGQVRHAPSSTSPLPLPLEDAPRPGVHLPADDQRMWDTTRPPLLPAQSSEVHPPIVQPPLRTTTPFNFHVADDSRGQLEELNEAANRLHTTAAAAEEAEDQREREFLTHEDHREQLFLQNEERRNQEARDRAAGILSDLESRIADLPAPAHVPSAHAPSANAPSAYVPSAHLPSAHTPSAHAPSVRFEDELSAEELAEQRASDRDSIRTISAIATQAASQHAADVLETVRLEREEAAREREAAASERELLLSELRVEKDRVIEEKDARIRALEDELAQLRGEFESERDQRAAEEAEMRERERQETAERDEFVRAQLGDITNLVQDQRDMLETKKALMDSRWEEKENRRTDKEAQMIELRDMVQKIHDDMEGDRERCDQERRDAREGLEKVIEDLQRQNAEQRELLTSLSESWRADCERHHHETIEAVKSTANEQVPFNVQGYLDEFSRALATEVRMLLGEVGKIREERRALQHEIGDLLCMKSKYGPGGEYEPDWKPGHSGPPPPPPEDNMPPMTDIPDIPAHIKGAWRPTTRPRTKKKKKSEQPQAPPAASTSAIPMHVPQPPYDMRQQHDIRQQHDLRQQLTRGSWATWQPDRNAVTPPSVEPTLMVPGRESPGLFGPRTPSTGSYERR
ncbi:hypothetical protein GALMADRAFT_570107 [Galerina marginata CBS 339.88]|uniref:Uncharacterized protein n=1 Tax=Galerina marginata (strain CBS 339.88) TaxID=685588 RepID=A0A067SY62_GALM3|nr:hypothetical protein GALMADRAFT_570107 [Galerina marginata CBS 339.88]